MRIIVSTPFRVQAYLYKAHLCDSQQPGTLVGTGVPAMKTAKVSVLYEAQILMGEDWHKFMNKRVQILSTIKKIQQGIGPGVQYGSH